MTDTPGVANGGDAGENGDTDGDGDDGEGEEERPEWATTWEHVGRELLVGELVTLRLDLGEAFRAAEEALYGPRDGQGEYAGDITAEHVRALRVALNRARERVEQEVAPVAGVEPWSEPIPRIPMHVLWEWTEHPNAESVDPEEWVAEYVDGLDAPDAPDADGVGEEHADE